MQVAEVTTRKPSPFASSLLFGYVAQRLIEGAFIVRFGMHIHVWRRFDSWFRLFTEISRPIAICWEVQLTE